MKKIAFILCCLFFVANRMSMALAGFFSPGMPANPAIQKAGRVNACYNIQDADARTMCLARAHREPGQCYSIQRADLRSQCLAEVQR